MSDNFPITPGSGRNAATDQVTHSGDTADVQLVRPVLVTGSEGSKTVVDLTGDNTNGLDVDVTRLPALVAGNANIGDVDIASIAAGDNNIGNVDVVTLPALVAGTANIGDVDVLTVPAVAGEAASTFNASSSDGATALTNSAQSVKGSAGSLKGWYIYNPNTSAQFVQFFNTASGSVTVGTTNPLFMLTIPAGSAANLWMQPGGIAFSTAISIAATSTAGGNGAPTTALDVVVWYV